LEVISLENNANISPTTKNKNKQKSNKENHENPTTSGTLLNEALFSKLTHHTVGG